VLLHQHIVSFTFCFSQMTTHFWTDKFRCIVVRNVESLTIGVYILVGFGPPCAGLGWNCSSNHSSCAQTDQDNDDHRGRGGGCCYCSCERHVSSWALSHESGRVLEWLLHTFFFGLGSNCLLVAFRCWYCCLYATLVVEKR